MTGSDRASVEAALAVAEALIEQVEAAGFDSVAAYIAEANDVRASLAVAAQVVAEAAQGRGWQCRTAIERLAVQVMELRLLVADATRELVVSSETSFVEVARDELGDARRGAELISLNPAVRYPWAIAPGTVLVVPSK